MHSGHEGARDERLGDFDSLLRQLEQPSDAVTVEGGYANLLSRLGSADFRRRCEDRR